MLNIMRKKHRELSFIAHVKQGEKHFLKLHIRNEQGGKDKVFLEIKNYPLTFKDFEYLDEFITNKTYLIENNDNVEESV